MNITIKEKDPFTVLYVEGRLDVETTPQLLQVMEDHIDKGKTVFAVDLSGLNYISSAGLAGMLSMHKKLHGMNGAVVYCGLEGTCKRVVEMGGFSSVLELSPTLHDLTG